MLVSQLVPIHPGLQLHVYFNFPSSHAPLLEHVWLAHSLIVMVEVVAVMVVVVVVGGGLSVPEAIA
jgi:hypothetical protein